MISHIIIPTGLCCSNTSFVRLKRDNTSASHVITGQGTLLLVSHDPSLAKELEIENYIDLPA